MIHIIIYTVIGIYHDMYQIKKGREVYDNSKSI